MCRTWRSCSSARRIRPTLSASRASERSAWWASPRPSPTPCTTQPASASVPCRSRSTSCCEATKESTMSTGGEPPDTIVLVHGLWLTPRSWGRWADGYTSRGYRVLAPAWPGMEGEVEALNADPSPIARLTVDRIVDHYEDIVLGLDRPPI